MKEQARTRRQPGVFSLRRSRVNKSPKTPRRRRVQRVFPVNIAQPPDDFASRLGAALSAARQIVVHTRKPHVATAFPLPFPRGCDAARRFAAQSSVARVDRLFDEQLQRTYLGVSGRAAAGDRDGPSARRTASRRRVVVFGRPLSNIQVAQNWCQEFRDPTRHEVLSTHRARSHPFAVGVEQSPSHELGLPNQHLDRAAAGS